MNGVGYQVLPIGRHAPGAARVHCAPSRLVLPRGRVHLGTKFQVSGRKGGRLWYTWDQRRQKTL